MTASGTTPWPSVVLVGGAAQDAAILQAGYGNGSYGRPAIAAHRLPAIATPRL